MDTQVFNLFDALLDAVFVVNGSNEIVYCNQPAGQMADLSVARMVGKMRLDEVLEVDDTSVFEQAGSLQCFEFTPYKEINYKVIRSKRSGVFRVCVQLIMMGDLPFVAVIARDVSLEAMLQEKYEITKSNFEKAEEEITAVRDQLAGFEKEVLDKKPSDLSLGLSDEVFKVSVENEKLDLRSVTTDIPGPQMAKLSNPVRVTVSGGRGVLNGKAVTITAAYIDINFEEPPQISGEKVNIEISPSQQFPGFHTTGVAQEVTQVGGLLRVEFNRLTALAKRAVDEYLEKNSF